MDIIRDSAIRIPFKYLKNPKVQEIKKFLTRYMKNENTQEDYVLKFYLPQYEKNDLLLPRFLDLFFDLSDFNINDKTCQGKDIKIDFKGQLRDKRQEESLQWFLNNYHGILCLEPGEGKTVISIKAITEIKKKTIIITHKTSLINQWKERILQFTNLKEKDISILKTDTYEKDLNKKIIISTVQTIVSMYHKFKRLDEIFYKAGIGMMIVDEVHAIIGPQQFSIASLHIPSYRCYGLTATPDRFHNKDIMLYHLGKIYQPSDTNIKRMQPEIKILKYKSKIPNKTRRFIYWQKKFNLQRYYQQLLKSDNFQKVLNFLIYKMKNTDRHILFLADRIKILDMIASYIKDENLYGFFIPRSGNKRQEALSKKFILSTYGSFRDGVDVPSLDCMVMVTPTSNIDQTVGRITRLYKNKKTPIVIDLVDIDFNEIQNRLNTRKRFYESKNWKIDEKEIIDT